MTETPSTSERLLSVAADLDLVADETVVEAAAESLEDLEAAAESMRPETPAATDLGHPGDDACDAFLAVYDDPRTGSDGPLSGLSLAVKDNIAARGLTMTCGSREFEALPSFDAAVVERLLEAGGDLVGKTNMDIFGFGPSGEFSDFAQVENPLAPDRVPGGSSSGSGAAVAAGLVDAALGTDTGGSVRMPAACCGTAGIKPTHGLVPRYGFVDMAPSLDTIGPLAPSVATVARVLEAIAGFDRRDPSSSQVATGSMVADLEEYRGLSIGVPEAFLDPATRPVREGLESLLDRLDEQPGVDTEIATLGDDFDRAAVERAYFLIAMTEFSWVLRQTGTTRGQGTGYEPEIHRAIERMRNDGVDNEQVVRRVLPAACLDATDGGETYAAARRVGIEFRRRLAAFFERYDLLVTPTIRTLPPEYGQSTGIDGVLALNGNCLPFNMSGHPAATVPVAAVDGLPVSAQVVAPHFEDALALRGARLAERVADYDSESGSDSDPAGS